MNAEPSRRLEEIVPALRTLAALSFEAPSLAPFRRTMRDWTLFELLKRDGLRDLGALGRLTIQDLRALPSVGRSESADEVVDLLMRIGGACGNSEKLGSCAELPVADFEVPAYRPREGGWIVNDVSPLQSIAPFAAADGAEGLARPWADRVKIAHQFPNLNSLKGLRLADPALRIAQTMPGDDLAHGWILRVGVDVVDDLLEFTRQDFLDARGLGPAKVSRLYEYLGRLNSAAKDIANLRSGGSDEDGLMEDRHPPLGVKPLSPDPRVALIIEWAASIAGAQTWADALTLVNASMPDDVTRAWRGLLSEPLPRHVPESALTAFLESDSRRARVLLARVASDEPLKLQQLAEEFGVTRERVRQIESRALSQTREAFNSAPQWRSVRWAAARLIEQAGSYAPSETLVEALPSWPARERHLVARLAGYERSSPVLIAEGVLLPSPPDLPLLYGTDLVIDEYELVEQLQAIGVLPRFLDFAMSAIGGLSRVDGQLVRWSGSVVDKAVAVLEVRDEPQVVEELVVAAYGDGASRSTRNRILEDPRIMRVTKRKVGLRRWGGAKYSGVAELMRDRLSTGPMDLDELAFELADRYEIAPASVQMYAAAPIFKLTGETVALRSAREPFLPRDSPHKIRGLYREAETATTVWCVAVDNDMLRGSGRSVPQEIAADLGVTPGVRIELQSNVGPISMAWSETSHVGPQIGSIREILRVSSASLGDSVALRFGLSELILEVVKLVPLTAPTDAADDIAWRTSLPSTVVTDPANLAKSIGVSTENLISSLEARGDPEIAALIPRLQRSVATPLDSTRQLPRTAHPIESEAECEAIRYSGKEPGNYETRECDLVTGGTSQQLTGSDDVGRLKSQGPYERDSVALEFDRAAAEVLDQMRSAGYDPRALRRLVTEVGPGRACELLAGLSEPSEAFVALYHLGRLDLSLEALMTSVPFRGLFDERSRRNVLKRLAEHGFESRGD